MSLYDDIALEKDKTDKPELAGWSSGIKLLQSQLQLKKATLTHIKKDQQRSKIAIPNIAPLTEPNKKIKKEEDLYPLDDELIVKPLLLFNKKKATSPTPTPPLKPTLIKEEVDESSDIVWDDEWNVEDQYDPRVPNDFEKIMDERREKKEREREEDRRRELEDRRRRRMERLDESELKRRKDDDEDGEDRRRRAQPNDFPVGGGFGAAIAPPPSLLDDTKPNVAPGSVISASLGNSVAAKIMARYGFKEGQGLGRQQQGMSRALQVEKTSKRGGKIIHERDLPKEMPPPPPPIVVPPPTEQQQSITDIMKNPSKVVLLRNMVGPGDVDNDLEDETKEECSKYGEINKCVIFEVPTASDDEAVRIFLEFKRMESAIKAVVDLNGRFFGGRNIKAGFYSYDSFQKLELNN